jgi:hypothetical protein
MGVEKYGNKKDSEEMKIIFRAEAFKINLSYQWPIYPNDYVLRWANYKQNFSGKHDCKRLLESENK